MSYSGVSEDYGLPRSAPGSAVKASPAGGIFKSAAVQVLRRERRLMTTGEICRLALDWGLLNCQGKTPEATMASSMYGDIKRKDRRSIFIRPQEGLFGLREWVDEGFLPPMPEHSTPMPNKRSHKLMRVQPGPRKRGRRSRHEDEDTDFFTDEDEFSLFPADLGSSDSECRPQPIPVPQPQLHFAQLPAQAQQPLQPPQPPQPKKRGRPRGRPRRNPLPADAPAAAPPPAGATAGMLLPLGGGTASTRARKTLAFGDGPLQMPHRTQAGAYRGCGEVQCLQAGHLSTTLPAQQPRYLWDDPLALGIGTVLSPQDLLSLDLGLGLGLGVGLHGGQEHMSPPIYALLQSPLLPACLPLHPPEDTGSIFSPAGAFCLPPDFCSPAGLSPTAAAAALDSSPDVLALHLPPGIPAISLPLPSIPAPPLAPAPSAAMPSSATKAPPHPGASAGAQCGAQPGLGAHALNSHALSLALMRSGPGWGVPGANPLWGECGLSQTKGSGAGGAAAPGPSVMVPLSSAGSAPLLGAAGAPHLRCPGPALPCGLPLPTPSLLATQSATPPSLAHPPGNSPETAQQHQGQAHQEHTQPQQQQQPALPSKPSESSRTQVVVARGAGGQEDTAMGPSPFADRCSAGTTTANSAHTGSMAAAADPATADPATASAAAAAAAAVAAAAALAADGSRSSGAGTGDAGGGSGACTAASAAAASSAHGSLMSKIEELEGKVAGVEAKWGPRHPQTGRAYLLLYHACSQCPVEPLLTAKAQGALVRAYHIMQQQEGGLRSCNPADYACLLHGVMGLGQVVPHTAPLVQPAHLGWQPGMAQLHPLSQPTQAQQVPGACGAEGQHAQVAGSDKV